MATNYLKVKPVVAEFLKLETIRPRTADGCYVLFINDLPKLGPARDMDNVAKAVGGVWLTGPQLREEQLTPSTEEMPPITDERIKTLAAEKEQKQETVSENENTPVEADRETEQENPEEEQQEPQAGTPEEGGER